MGWFKLINSCKKNSNNRFKGWFHKAKYKQCILNWINQIHTPKKTFKQRNKFSQIKCTLKWLCLLRGKHAIIPTWTVCRNKCHFSGLRIRSCINVVLFLVVFAFGNEYITVYLKPYLFQYIPLTSFVVLFCLYFLLFFFA